MHSFRLCATLLIKKLKCHRSMTFCDLVTICDTWFDGKFIRNKSCHNVLDAKSYDSKVTGLQRQFGTKKLVKTMFFALFHFLLKKLRLVPFQLFSFLTQNFPRYKMAISEIEKP
jgi:hypothetical protein